MPRRNPYSRSSSSPNVDKKLSSFLLMLDAQKRPLKIKSPIETYIPRQKFTSSAETKNIGTWEVTDIAQRRVKHHPFRHGLSRFFTNDYDLQCALHYPVYGPNVWALALPRLESRFPSNLEVGTIPYRTVHMIITCRTSWIATSWIMELRLGSRFPCARAVHYMYKVVWNIMNCDYKK